MLDLFDRVADFRCSRQVAAFALGWVFFYSIQCLAADISSRLARRFKVKCPIQRARADLEKADHNARKASLTQQVDVASAENLRVRGNNPVLKTTLVLCFVFASVAYFASLMSFKVSSKDSGCGTSDLL
jgi:hypothetical protein